MGWVLPICWWLIGFAGCEIWRLKFHSTGFEFNFLGFKFAGFVLLFKYIMCSCLIYQFYCVRFLIQIYNVFLFKFAGFKFAEFVFLA